MGNLVKLSFVLFILSAVSFAGKLPDGSGEKVSKTVTGLDDLKMRKRFGVGFSAGGPLAIMGVEVDLNLDPDVSLSGGIGTGLQFSTYMVKLRYFLPGEWVSPYFGVGLARWQTESAIDNRISPALLRSKYLNNQGAPNGFDFFIAYPAFGAQFMDKSGLSFFAEIQALFRLFDFTYGTYAAVGMHWYL